MICGKAILLLWLFQFGYGQIKNPGIEISLGARGLDLARRIASEQLTKSISKLYIGHIAFDHGEVNNLRVTSFRLGNTRINPATPNWVTLGIAGAEISLSAKWKYTKHIIFKVTFKGSATMTASSVDISQSVSLARNREGKPVLLPGPCAAHIGRLKYKLKGGLDASILNFFAGFFKNTVKKTIQNQICPNIKKYIDDFNGQTANNLKVDYPISQNVFVNVALGIDPTASPYNITAGFEGRFYSIKSPPTFPFPNPPIPELPMTSQMARVIVGDYSINTYLYTLWQYETFNWTFPQSKIDRTIGTNVTADLLAETMSIFKKYLHSGVPLMMLIYTPSTPLAKFTPNGINVSGPFGFSISVLLGRNKTPLKVFDVALDVNLTGKVNVTGNSITVQVASLTFSAGDLAGFPSEFLSKLLNAAARDILPALNEVIGKAPFMLPSYFGYQFSNFNIQFARDFIVIGSDVEHVQTEREMINENYRIEKKTVNFL